MKSKLIISTAVLLKKTPRIKLIVKKIYYYVNYLLKIYKIKPITKISNVEILTLNEWIGIHSNIYEQFYGYYDLSPWDETGRYIICHELKCKKAENINVVLFDKQSKEKKIIGKSTAWNYQQGTRAQWIKIDKQSYIIFNIIEGNKLNSAIVDISGKIIKKNRMPIQIDCKNGKSMISLNYKRLNKNAYDYGYKRLECAENNDENDGLWEYYYFGEKPKLLVSIARLTKINKKIHMANASHYINHVMMSPDSLKLIFVHRWKKNNIEYSRLYIYYMMIDKLKLVMDEELVSHYCWIDDKNVLVYGKNKNIVGYFLVNINHNSIIPVKNKNIDHFNDGHPIKMENKNWIITDTYPDSNCMQMLYFLNYKNGDLIKIAKLFHPPWFNEYSRCDLHPKTCKNEKLISIDTVCMGVREMRIVDYSKIVFGI